MIRLLADLSVRNKGAARIREGLVRPLTEASRARGWRIDFVVPSGVALSPGPDSRVHVMADRSDLVLEEVVLPRLAARYHVVYTQRESLRLTHRRPNVVLQLHEHHHVRYAPWPTVRHATRGALRAYRTSRMYRLADHICFSSAWTRDEFRRLEQREPVASSLAPLAGWPDGQSARLDTVREPISVMVASNDTRDEIDWALEVWERADLPSPWSLVMVGRNAPAKDNRIRSVGRLCDADLQDLISRAGFYLHIGRVEGFGLSIVEALQLGTPVIARRGSAVDELLGNGGGYLVDDAEGAALAMRALAEGAIDSVAAAEAGSRYAWYRTAQAVAEACEGVTRR